MPTMARGRIFLARGIHCCPIFYLFLPILRLFFAKKMCMYTHIYDCVKIVYELPLLPNNTAGETFLYRSEAGQSVNWIFIM
jgi:hypothetical protein